ncbi:YycH family regulatory protein [Bacillus sp. FJAT-44742]|uniref:YycH family regulatory protein n=1 Tax=Bacillus sp. FJAT-44742 TaxID=2014005 RepID=UPI000C24C401|nr:two-component system activity regulator YycH [Bacillus sp. FJAT-44742]
MIERVKSGLLTILVIISLFLTWLMWTYQPDYDLLQGTEPIESDPYGEELNYDEVVWPERMILHTQLGSTMVDGQESLFVSFYENLLDAGFEELSVSTSVDTENLYDVESGIELIFPAPIPSEVLGELFEFEEDEPYLTVGSADRFLFTHDEENEEVLAHLISYEEDLVIEASTTLSVSDFENQYLNRAGSYPEVFAHHVNEGNEEIPRLHYLPENPLTYPHVQYTSVELQAEPFIDYLFSDPTYVKHYRQENGTESFTDGNRMMNLTRNGRYLNYINPVFSDHGTASQQHVVNTSFDFINSHGGWTDQYHLYSWSQDADQDESRFRLIIEGVPVFESNGVNRTSLFVTRSGTQTSRYSRPMYDIDVEEEPIESTPYELPAGQEVLDYIDQHTPFSEEEIENIRVGYQMDRHNLVLAFEPMWFVKYRDSWYPLEINNSEGEEHGLE